MKKTIAILSLAASAMVLSSCGVTDFAPCLSKTGEAQQECVTGILIDKVVAYLAESGAVNSAETADAFASKWSAADNLISGAKNMGVNIPASVTKPYNSTLARMAKHNYFGSADLTKAMSSCKPL